MPAPTRHRLSRAKRRDRDCGARPASPLRSCRGRDRARPGRTRPTRQAQDRVRPAMDPDDRMYSRTEVRKGRLRRGEGPSRALGRYDSDSLTHDGAKTTKPGVSRDLAGRFRQLARAPRRAPPDLTKSQSTFEASPMCAADVNRSAHCRRPEPSLLTHARPESRSPRAVSSSFCVSAPRRHMAQVPRASSPRAQRDRA